MKDSKDDSRKKGVNALYTKRDQFLGLGRDCFKTIAIGESNDIDIVGQ